jgi:hypothetical protein
VKRRIDVSDKEITFGSALRIIPDWPERTMLEYDPHLPARCNDVILGEVDRIPSEKEIYEFRDDGVEKFFRQGHKVRFGIERIKPGWVAIAVGNRYAPRSITGGLVNPITGKTNGQIIGGTILFNICAFNVAGFVNTVTPAGRFLTPIKVLGTLTEADGRPLSLLNYPKRFTGHPSHSFKGVLVCGAMMESGKTSCCIAIMRTLRAIGKRATYEKKTGTACFSDPVRVLRGDIHCYGEAGQSVEFDVLDLMAGDFVDGCGTVSDVSIASSMFVKRSVAFTHGFAAVHKTEVHIVELADNMAHTSNLALLRNTSFRSLFSHLVYVPSPSIDSAFHFLHYLRNEIGWSTIRVAFSGPLANDPEYRMLCEEIEHRLKVPCIRRDETEGWLRWLYPRGGGKRC